MVKVISPTPGTAAVPIDASVSCIVAKGEGDFDMNIFNDPEAGLEYEEVDLPDVETSKA